MFAKSRRPSYREANQQPDVLLSIHDDLLFKIPKKCEKMETREVDGRFLATDGCDLLEMEHKDKVVQQFYDFQRILIWCGLRFDPTQRKSLLRLKYIWLYFCLFLGSYTIAHDLYQNIADFHPKSAPMILVFASLMMQAMIMLLFATYWQRKLYFELFFHLYRHSKITDVSIYDREHGHLRKRTSRQFWGLQIYSLLFTMVFLWTTWADINGVMNMETLVHPSFKYTFYFTQLTYIRSINCFHCMAAVSFCIHVYWCLTDAIYIEIKKFNWKISELQTVTSSEMKEQLEELIHIHTKLCRLVRSLDSIFKIFAFILTAFVIPTIILVLTLVLSRSTFMDVILSTPTIAFCMLEYYAIMYPSKIHAELSKSKALLCMNYNVWIPYEESVNKVAQTLVLHLDQADLGISLWGFTIVSRPLILTTISAMMTCLAFFLDLRPKSDSFDKSRLTLVNHTVE